MQKKHSLLILAIALLLGTVATSLSSVKSHPGSTGVYIYVDPQIVPGSAGGVLVKISIDSPDAWDNTADGIVGWALSVRVDPTVLTVHPVGARKAYPWQPTAGGVDPAGFLELFLVRNGYNYWDSIFMMWTIVYPTDFYIGEKDPATGTIFDISEQIRGYGALGVGAGGGPYPLCELLFADADADALTGESVIDLFGPPRPPIIEIEPMYLTVDGTWHSADVVTDGYYRAETPYKKLVDLNKTASVIGSLWHELWPEYCEEWRMDSHQDTDEDGALDESEQVDMTLLPLEDYKAWYHVDWVNPDPVPLDGKTDLIVTWKEDIPVPEFPLGIGLMMLLALAIPIAYLWRTRKKVRS